MYPVLFKIFGFEIRTFGVMIALGFLFGVAWARKRAPQFGVSPEKVMDIAFWLLLFMVLGARIAHIVLYWSHYAKHTNELLTLRFEGLVSYGALIFGFVTFYVLAKRNKVSMPVLLDLFVPTLLLAHIFGRAGCFLNGCCYGRVASEVSSFAVRFQGHADLNYPTQIYDMVLTLLGLFVLIRVEKRGVAPGQMVSMLGILYGLVRFVTEFWRIGEGGSSTFAFGLSFSDAQIFSLLLMLVSTVSFWKFGHSKSSIKR